MQTRLGPRANITLECDFSQFQNLFSFKESYKIQNDLQTLKSWHLRHTVCVKSLHKKPPQTPTDKRCLDSPTILLIFIIGYAKKVARSKFYNLQTLKSWHSRHTVYVSVCTKNIRLLQPPADKICLGSRALLLLLFAIVNAKKCFDVVTNVF